MIKTLYIVLIALMNMAILLPPEQTKAAEVIEFEWALLQDTESGQAPVDFATTPALQTGTALQIYLKPYKQTYLYLFLLDSEGRFIPVFPTGSHDFDSLTPDTPILLPEGRNRFSLVPPPGQERFYLLASPLRLKETEELIEACMQRPTDIEIHAELFQNVKTVRRKNSGLTQFTEKGMPVSGTRHDLRKTRGAREEVQFIATHIVAEGFYSKIIRINHE